MNTWKDFGTELKRKFKKPWNNPSFLGYFLVCAIFGGAAGVYISVYQYACTEPYKIAFSLGTYYAAIMAAAFADINLSKKIGEKSSFFIYSLLICVLGVVLLVATYLLGNKQTQWAFLPSGMGCILALILWVIAYAEHENFSVPLPLEESIRDNTNNKHGANWDNNE